MDALNKALPAQILEASASASSGNYASSEGANSSLLTTATGNSKSNSNGNSNSYQSNSYSNSNRSGGNNDSNRSSGTSSVKINQTVLPPEAPFKDCGSYGDRVLSVHQSLHKLSTKVSVSTLIENANNK
jgi:hypothetical protein